MVEHQRDVDFFGFCFLALFKKLLKGDSIALCLFNRNYVINMKVFVFGMAITTCGWF
jgi:hypothetical protein